MLSGCSLLLDINTLQNWNVSNGNDFSSMISLFNVSVIGIQRTIEWDFECFI